MNRDDVIDNLEASRDRRELVTVRLRPLRGWDSQMTGVVLALGEHYTNRRALQAVMQVGPNVVVIAVSSIVDFRVGPPVTTAPGWRTS